jgi:hypothetical protein
MITYAGRRLDDEAMNQLTTLLAFPHGGRMKEIILDAVDESGQNTVALCESIFNITRETSDNGEMLETEIDSDLSLFYFYPIHYEPIPSKVCPYPDLVMDRLRTDTIPAQLDPVTDLGNSNYEFSLPNVINIDEDPEEEWIGLIYQDDYIVSVLDYDLGGWQIMPLVYTETPIVSMEAALFDVESDGTLEILILLKSEEKLSNDCDKDDSSYILYLISNDDQGYSVNKKRTIPCHFEKPVELTSLQGRKDFIDLVNEYGWSNIEEEDYTAITSIIPDWVDLIGFEKLPNQLGKFNHLDDLMANIQSKNSLEETRIELINIKESLPTDDPSAKRIKDQIVYLLGLSYEVENEFDEAVQIYLALIQESPESLWSSLAWLRLKPNP